MNIAANVRKYLLLITTALILTSLCASCQENDGEEDEYAHWQARNEAYFAHELATDRDSIA